MKILSLALLLTSFAAFSGEPENTIATVTANTESIDCPVLVTENQAVYCAKFSYADDFGQIAEANRVSALGTVKLAGQWEESSQLGENGNALIFIINTVSEL